MSDKKVNSKMLKDLIKEVLAEQKLDEKNVKGITLKDLQPYINKSGKTGGQYYKKAKTKQDFTNLLDPAATRVVKTVKQVAGKGGDKKAIDDDDLSKSGIDATFKAAWSDAISKKGKTITVPGSSNPPVTGGATAAELTAAGVSKSSKVGDWKNAVVKAFNAGNIALAKRLHVSFGVLKYTKKGKLKLPKSGPYVKATNLLNGTTNPPAGTPVSTAVADLYDQITQQTQKI